MLSVGGAVKLIGLATATEPWEINANEIRIKIRFSWGECFWKCLLQNVCHFTSGAYKKHLLTHEEHSIWKCDQCPYTCELRSGYAAVHMARAHNINRHEVRKKYRRHKQIISVMSQKRHSVSDHRQLGYLFKQGRAGISYMYRHP